MVEELMVESEKILGSNVLQPGSGGSGISCKVAAAGSGGWSLEGPSTLRL